MSKKIALVTGAMGGIGTEISKFLVRDGFTVVANCLPAYPQKDAWLAKMKAEGFDFIVAEGDIASYESCTAMVQKIEAEVGPVDVLVNNAGITRDGMFRKMDRAQWDAVIDINLSGVFNVTHQVIGGMADRGWGRVINISSVNGIRGQAGQTNYAAAKAGELGFTKSLALEVAKKGVTVNAIAPGYIATEMVMAIKEEVRNQLIAQIPVGRAGKPEEIAGLVSYLASDIAGFMTGATLNINGGLHIY